MTDNAEASTRQPGPDNTPESKEAPDPDHGTPVDDGPGQHHTNVDTTNTARQQSKMTHKF